MMKRTLLLFIAFVLSCLAYGQEEFITVDFKKYQFRTDTFLKISDNTTRNMYKAFFTGPDLSSKKTKVAYPVSKSEANHTDISKLKGKVWKITDILEPDASKGRKNKMLVLEEIVDGEILYYDSWSDYPPFVVHDPVMLEQIRQEEERKERERAAEERRKEEEKIAATPYERDDYDQFKEVELKGNYHFYRNAIAIVGAKPLRTVPNDFYFEVPGSVPDKERRKPTMNMITKGTYRVKNTEKQVFELEDLETGEILYYKYNPYAPIFPLRFKDIEYTPESARAHLSRKTDNINKIETIWSAYGPMDINKEIKNGKATYYLTFRTKGSTLNVNIKGVKVLFEDGMLWSRNSNVHVDPGEGIYWDYSSFMDLTAADLKMFSSKKIEEFQLYIYQQRVPDEFAEMFRAFVQAVMAAE